MIYPNGSLSLQQLSKMLNSDEYIIYFEPNDEPEDWDWRHKGFWRSPNRVQLVNTNELFWALESEYNKQGSIIYDMTENYFKNHPYEGEEVSHVDTTFNWQYSSPYGKKYCYKICPCTYLGEAPKHIPLEIVCYDNGFKGSCFQIGSWTRDKEGYEFRSCGNRLWKYVDEKDIPVIWNILKEVDEFLAKKFLEEGDD
jgi:hypothetical protein